MRCLLLLLGAAACRAEPTKDTAAPEDPPPPAAPTVTLEDVRSTEPLQAVATGEGELSYRWTRDGEAAEITGPVVPPEAHARGQRWAVEVQATLDGRASEPAVAEAQILNGLPPTPSVALVPAAPRTGDAVTLMAEGLDPDGDALTFEASWTVDGAPGPSGLVLEAGLILRGQSWQAEVGARDDVEAGDRLRVGFVVANAPPQVESLTWSPPSADVTTPLRAELRASDLEGDPLTVVYTFEVDGAEVQRGPSPDLAAGVARRDQVVKVRVEVSDGEATTLGEAELTITNAAPQLSGLTLSPVEVTQDDTLVVALEGVVDPDGDEVVPELTWLVDGVEVFWVGPELELSADGLPRDGLVSVEATVSDGDRRSAVVRGGATRVLDTPPRLFGALLAPTPADERTTLEVSLSGGDPDDDPLLVTYAWTVNGEPAGAEPTLTGAAFDRDDEVACVVEVATATTPPVRLETPPVIIQNSPPTAGSALLEPAAPLPGQDVDCRGQGGSDPDGDVVSYTYRWRVNGRDAGAGARLGGSSLVRDDRVECTATPTDGRTVGDPVVVETRVVNGGPPPVHARLGPASPVFGRDDLVCDWDGPYPVDPDGDFVEVIAHWTVDGRPYSGPWVEDRAGQGRIPGHRTTAGRTWTCTLETRDVPGGVGGLGDSAEVTNRIAGGNFLVVIADDLGTDAVGAYADHPTPPPTPRLDRLAASGVLFRNGYAQPICSPTRASLLTGRYGRRYGVGVIVDAWDDAWPVPQSELFLPHVLDQGAEDWTSAIVGKWHLGNAIGGPDDPLERGFDFHAGSLDNLGSPSPIDDGRPKGYFEWAKSTNGSVEFTTRYATTDTTDDAITQLATLPEPWFLMVAYNAPHSPAHVPPEGLHTQAIDEGSSDLAKYVAMVEALDTEVGRLLDALTPAQRATTTVVFVGDNGTPDWAIRPPREAPQYKGSLYEGGVNVPLLVAGPHVARPGSESAALVHVVDLFATGAALAGVDPYALTRPDLTGGPDQELTIDGQSLLPYLADPDHPGYRSGLYLERFGPNGHPPYLEENRRAVTDGAYKLMRIKLEGLPLEERFFALSEEGLEGEDLLLAPPLSAEAAAAKDRLTAELDAYEADFSFDVPAWPPRLASVSLSPPEPTVFDLISCLPGPREDLNLDPITLRYDWLLNGVRTGIPTASLPPGFTSPGDRVACEVTPDDGLLLGAPVRAEVVIR